MKISKGNLGSLLVPCDLEGLAYQLDTYSGCEHYCHYCYVLRKAQTDWRNELIIHDNFVLRLRGELEKLHPQTLYMGYHADPYQPCEVELQQTRKALEIFQEYGFSASILTKSDLVLRDQDILQNMPDSMVSVSVALKDSGNRRLFEEKTVETGERIHALAELKKAGIRTGALLCPVIPYITETLELLDDLSDYADTIWVYALSGNSDDPEDRGWINTKRILDDSFGHIAGEVESAIMNKDHPFWSQLRNEIASFASKRDVDLRIHI